MIQGINHITWNVLDIDQAFHFYTDLLGIQPIMKSNKSAYFLVGSCWCAIVLGECKTENSYNHLAFDVLPEEFNFCVQKLKNAGVVEWKKNNTEGDSFYFLDPSGNKFELHSSTLKNRINEGKANWGSTVTWFV
jgi:catechol 2,3-dioxygenase-like lactoylglutathione lyase family enzyme